MPTIKYQVYDTRTGQPIGAPVASLTAAARKRDRLDNQYGACRYAYRRMEV